MTITANLSTVTLNGNGVATSFPFNFWVPDASALQCWITDSAGQLNQTTNFTVSLTESGGTVAYPASGGAALPAGAKITIMRNMPFTQQTDLVNATTFHAEVVEDALDNLTAQAQQIAEAVGRAVKVPIGSTTDPADLISQLEADAATASNAASAAATQAGIATTQAGIATASATFLSGLEAHQAATYGASTSSTDNATAIQAGIDALTALGGGFLDFGSGTYTTGPLTLKTGVILRGRGLVATTLKLKNAVNATFITSKDFATLTGSNKWLTSDGVPYGFGLESLSVDGNKANQSAGNAVSFYGKGIHVRDVMVRNAKAVGYYSECANVGGQTDWTDTPEGNIDNLHVRDCDSHGVHYCGPHDGNIRLLYSAQNGGDGVRFESSATMLAGTEIGRMHIYANRGRGIYAKSASFRAGILIAESNVQEGIFLDLNSTYCQVGIAQLYSNQGGDSNTQLVIEGMHNSFGNVQVQDKGRMSNGVWVAGIRNNIDYLYVQGAYGGAGATTTGLIIGALANELYSGSGALAAHATFVKGHIEGFYGAGGVGVQTGRGGTSQDVVLNLYLALNTVMWTNTTAGLRSKYTITAYCASGQTMLAGVGPTAIDQQETWDVKSHNADGSNSYSEVRFLYAGTTVDLNSTAEQEIVIPHLLLAAPEIEDCLVSLSYTGANTTYVVQSLRVTAVDATNVTVKIKLSTAAGSAATGNIKLWAKL